MIPDDILAERLARLATPHLARLTDISPRARESSLPAAPAIRPNPPLSVDAGTVRTIGVSNTYDVRILERLARDTGRPVQVVQNRWFEGNGWDREVCRYCCEHGIQYQ